MTSLVTQFHACIDIISNPYCFKHFVTMYLSKNSYFILLHNVNLCDGREGSKKLTYLLPEI